VAVIPQHKHADDIALRLPVAHTLLDVRPLLLSDESSKHDILAQPIAPAQTLSEPSAWQIMRRRALMPVTRLDALLITLLSAGIGNPALHEVRELVDQLIADTPTSGFVAQKWITQGMVYEMKRRKVRRSMGVVCPDDQEMWPAQGGVTRVGGREEHVPDGASGERESFGCT